eukprot:m.151046 g.151046  ORF g.151046 m.151046 type:complete len:153 (+) comp14242_c0_seq1:1066-1524(+)
MHKCTKYVQPHSPLRLSCGCVVTGVGETALQFVLYEHLKQVAHQDEAEPNGLKLFLCGATAKLCAVVVAYPHEVVRTRLRQETHAGPRKYTSFMGTLMTVYREEGWRRLYSGMNAHILRAVPNTAITLLVYEMMVWLYQREVANVSGKPVSD